MPKRINGSHSSSPNQGLFYDIKSTSAKKGTNCRIPFPRRYFLAHIWSHEACLEMAALVRTAFQTNIDFQPFFASAQGVIFACSESLFRVCHVAHGRGCCCWVWGSITILCSCTQKLAFCCHRLLPVLYAWLTSTITCATINEKALKP